MYIILLAYSTCINSLRNEQTDTHLLQNSEFLRLQPLFFSAHLPVQDNKLICVTFVTPLPGIIR